MDRQEISREMTIASGQYLEEEEYWLRKLSGERVHTGFIADHRGTDAGEGRLAAERFRLSDELASGIAKLGTGSDPKMHMILISGLLVLLNKYTGNEDIIVGTPIYKQDVEADYVNTVLVLRNHLNPGMTFRQLLLQVRQTIVEADEHQNYPLEVLMQRLELSHPGAASPLFDVVLLMEGIHDRSYIRHVAPDVIFSISRREEHFEGVAEYNASRYEDTTIRRIIDHYIRVLQIVVQDVDLKLADIDILSAEERRQLLVDFNDTQALRPPDKPLHDLFEQQVRKRPHHVAFSTAAPVSRKNRRGMAALTYRELNGQADRLAGILRESGIAAGSVAGIMMERSPDMIIGLLAILKAGGAYLPIDPAAPPERILFMLRDAGADALLSHSSCIEHIPFTSLRNLDNGEEGGLTVTPPRHHIEAFDRLPRPDRSLINLKRYKGKIGMASVTDCISLQATRGCPYECLFCHKIWSKHHTYRSAENIFAEIEYYYKNGVRHFAFIDDCFNLNLEKSGRLFQLILESRLQIRLFFPNGLRGDILRPAYIDLMVEAGTRGINLSLETASPRLQRLIKKELDLDRFKTVVDYIARQHPGVILEMATMHGYPTETEEEAMMTLDFIKGIKWLHFPYIHILKIFPNTEMEAFALDHGISKESILLSRDRAFHELPETLPFPKSFTRQYQAHFLNEYFLSGERLEKVLPVQMEILSEAALAQKYNAYLPVEIRKVEDVVDFAGLDNIEIPGGYEKGTEAGESLFDLDTVYPEPKPAAGKILLLDLSQHFSSHRMLYRVVEQPLGLISLVTYLKQCFGDRIDGRIYKAGNDFDSFEELKLLVNRYKPDLVGIRTLTFFKEFFHRTVSLLRQWGVRVPIITGGPYAASDYGSILKDKNIDLVVLGEGEHTLAQLIEEWLRLDFEWPGPAVLSKINGIAFRNDSSMPDRSCRVILSDNSASGAGGEDFHNPESVSGAGDLAYVMYTSGSTGKPKGVMVEHRQVNNCISWMQEKFDLSENNIIVQRTNLTFDPSVWEIFWPLSVGASFRLIEYHDSIDPQFLIGLMEEHSGLTMMYCPATLVNMMANLLEKKTGEPPLAMPWLIIGAEPIGKGEVKKFYAGYRGQIVNTYGPTECTINNTFFDIHRHDDRAYVPIGRPVANNRIYVLSAAGQLQPLHVPGEICIGGESVSRGYINNPGQTAECFVNDPFGTGRLYRTGDIGRWRQDGSLEFMGRLDEQVKIRGYRIEPGEITSALLGHRGIRDCLVTVRDSRDFREEVKACRRCGITSAYPGIAMNRDNVCEICLKFDTYKKNLDAYFGTLAQLDQAVRKENVDNTSGYDCLLLYSGGRGSAYALYQLADMGFRVLAMTYDNGYFGKGDLESIEKITSRLGVDHIVVTHPRSDLILKESLKSAHTVCRGCFHTSYSLAARYACRHDIKVVVGATLSRGQIIENKLFMYLQQGVTDTGDLEDKILKLQKMAPELDQGIFDHIDIAPVIDGSIHDRVKFIDFYRYCDITNREMISYLNERDAFWRTRKNYAVYSTNCPIKAIGDYAHLQSRRFHFYGSATSWEKRLGHLDLDNIGEDLACRVTRRGYESFLKKIGHDPVDEAEKQDKYLCAYIVARPSEAEAALSVSRLREYLAKQLPDYMIPNYFVFLDEIPLTPNGKVDKRALPEPRVSRTKPGDTFVAPRTDLEKKIAELWRQVLKSDQVGVNDNFFDLGGNSLGIIELHGRLKDFLGKEIPIVTMFTYPTIGSLAGNLEQEGTGMNDPESDRRQSELIDKGKRMMKQGMRKTGRGM